MVRKTNDVISRKGEKKKALLTYSCGPKTREKSRKRSRGDYWSRSSIITL